VKFTGMRMRKMTRVRFAGYKKNLQHPSRLPDPSCSYFLLCRSCIYLTVPVWMRTMFKLIFKVRIASRWLVAYVRLRPAFSFTRFSVQSEGYYFLRFLWFEFNFSPLPF
ncbi:hypothetical protein, partial [Marivirga sp.]|uniref:hypothetical protein n=1 Tax=Marivirga sp. TaxID=2018662 RepID=UPI0025EF685F